MTPSERLWGFLDTVNDQGMTFAQRVEASIRRLSADWTDDDE